MLQDSNCRLPIRRPTPVSYAIANQDGPWTGEAQSARSQDVRRKAPRPPALSWRETVMHGTQVTHLLDASACTRVSENAW
jgi:hypothetical protein